MRENKIPRFGKIVYIMFEVPENCKKLISDPDIIYKMTDLDICFNLAERTSKTDIMVKSNDRIKFFPGKA